MRGWKRMASKVLDALVINGTQLDEPSAATSADGSFSLFVPAEFDRNQNGLLDASEGRWYLRGGIVASTGLPLLITLIAPADATVITPLTTLLTTMIDQFGDTPAAAQSKLLESLGLDSFDILHDSTIDQVLTGDSAAPARYLAGIQVLDTVHLLASFFDELTAIPLRAVEETVFVALAEHLRQSSGPVQLSDVATIQNIVRKTAVRLNTDVPEEAFDALALVLSESNASLEVVASVAGAGLLADVARVEQVAQDLTAADLRSFVRGELTSQEMTERHTGAALAILIEQATPGNTRIPRIEVADVSSNPRSAPNR